MAWKLLDEEPQQEKSFDVKNFLKEGGESLLRQGGRALASGASGLIGGIGELANLASHGAEAIGLASPQGAEEFRKKTLTTEKIREGLQKEIPSLKPQNKIEQFSDDVFETMGSLLGGPSKLLTKFGLSVGSNLVKEYFDQASGERNSKNGEYAKMGILFIGSVIDPKKAATEISKRYAQAQSLLAPGTKMNAKNLKNSLQGLEKSITVGRPRSALSEAERSVLSQIDKTKQLIKNDSIDVAQAVAQRQSLYDDLKNLYNTVGAGNEKKAKILSKKIPHFLNETVEEFGKVNPEYAKLFRSADQMSTALYGSKKATRWVERNFKHSPLAKYGLFVVGAPANQVGKTIYKIYKSPELRKLYAKAIKEASTENLRAFAKTSDELDSKLRESESKEKWEFID